MSFAPTIHFSGDLKLGGTRVFDKVEFALEAAEWTCLLGPSGIGKSTVLKLIAGLLPEGEFSGSIAASDNAQVAERTCFMAQKDLLLPWLDVCGNITLGARLRGETPDRHRADDLIEKVGLRGHAHKKPAALSGGMRQRVALARTLMEDRPIVLLDEPFSALDARTRAEMQDLAVAVLEGRTVLLVTHDPAEAARLGHQVLLMDPSAIAKVTTPATTPIRAFDAPETLALQARLFARLGRQAA